MNTRTRRRKRNASGVILVEAVLVMPILLMLTLGAIEYGWLFLNEQQVVNAARQGARIAILPYANAETDARTNINQSLTAAGLSDDSPAVTITKVAIAGDPDGRMGEKVVITVPTSHLLIVNAPKLFPTPTAIHATVTMAREGP